MRLLLLTLPVYFVGPCYVLRSVWFDVPEVHEEDGVLTSASGGMASWLVVPFENLVYFIVPYFLFGMNFTYFREFTLVNDVFGLVCFFL